MTFEVASVAKASAAVDKGSVTDFVCDHTKTEHLKDKDRTGKSKMSPLVQTARNMRTQQCPQLSQSNHEVARGIALKFM